MKWCTKLEVARKRCPKVIDFYPNWVFPYRNYSLNWPMATKWCKTLEYQYNLHKGHIINGLTGIVDINDYIPICVWLLGRLQLSDPSDLPCCYYHWLSRELSIAFGETNLAGKLIDCQFPFRSSLTILVEPNGMCVWVLICIKIFSSNINHTLGGSKLVDYSDVVGTSPIGAAPTTSSFST